VSGPYYGKYRGIVINNVDPNRMGRLQVSCVPVLGLNIGAWAMPCVPFAGASLPDRQPEGFLMLPSIGSNVWVEFEQGNPDLPIWSGCFWDSGGAPSKVILPTVRTIVAGGVELTLDSTPGAGGFTVKVSPPTVAVPCEFSCSATGIAIKIGAASIKLDPIRVQINDGALEVK
jgi:hypothetical protein